MKISALLALVERGLIPIGLMFGWTRVQKIDPIDSIKTSKKLFCAAAICLLVALALVVVKVKFLTEFTWELTFVMFFILTTLGLALADRGFFHFKMARGFARDLEEYRQFIDVEWTTFVRLENPDHIALSHLALGKLVSKRLRTEDVEGIASFEGREVVSELIRKISLCSRFELVEPTYPNEIPPKTIEDGFKAVASPAQVRTQPSAT